MEFKPKVYAHCLTILDEKISHINKAIRDLSNDAGSDMKSTAGDKHETSRAMMHLEQEKLTHQLSELKVQQESLHRLNPEANPETDKVIRPGSLVETDKGWFYISAGVGKVNVDGKDIFAISVSAPLAGMLTGKSEGDVVKMNDRTYRIISVF